MTPTLSTMVLAFAVGTGLLWLGFGLYLAYKKRKSSCAGHHFGQREGTGNFDVDVTERSRSALHRDRQEYRISLWEETERPCLHNECDEVEEGRRHVGAETVRFGT